MVKGNLLCGNCGVNESDFLQYFVEHHHEVDRTSFIDPILVCGECHARMCQSDDLFEIRPQWVDFNKLATRDGARVIGWLTSMKGHEVNQMANKFWKAKLWNAKHVRKGDIKKEGGDPNDIS